MFLVLPPLNGADASGHYARVVLIADGWLIPPPTGTARSTYQLDGCVVAVLRGGSLTRPKQFLDQFRDPKCVKSGSARRVVGALPRAEVYSPVSYLPAAVGYRIGRGVGGVVWATHCARLATIAAYIAMVAFAIKLIPWGKPFMFAIGLLPVLINSVVSFSADPVTVGLALLAVALALNVADRSETFEKSALRWRLGVLTVVCVALGLAKSAYLPMTLVVATIPTAAFTTMGRRVRYAVVTMGTAAIAAVSWFGLAARHIELAIPFVTSRASIALSDKMLADPFTFLSAAVRSWLHLGELEYTIKGMVVLHS